MKHFSIALVLTFLLAIHCFSQGQQVVQTALSESYINTQLSWVVIDAPNGTFGYNIASNGKTIIHQPGLSFLNGGEGLKTKADAVKVARAIIEKIKKGDMAPAITPEELGKLGIAK
jgi:hypothetical protein